MSSPPENAPLTAGEGSSAGTEILEFVHTLLKHKWLILGMTALVSVSTLLWTIGQPKIYEAVATIEYDPDPPRPLGREVEDVAAPVFNYWATQEFYQTQNRIIASRSVAELVVRKLGLHRDLDFLQVPEDERPDWEDVSVEDAAQVLQRRLSVGQVPDTRLVRVGVRDTDPERARILANAVADSYIEKVMRDRLGSTEDALRWLSTQLEDLKNKLEASELALHSFKRDHDVLANDMESRQSIISSRLERLNEEMTEAATKSVELSARLAELRRAKREDPMAVQSTVVSESETVEALRAAYRAKEAERKALATRYGESHPQMTAIAAELTELRAQMRSEIEGIIARVEGDLREVHGVQGGLEKELDLSKQEGLELNLKEIEYQRLNRERENHAKLHGVLLERTTETGLTYALKVSYVNMIDPALDGLKVSPRLGLNLALGILAGLLLGIGASVLVTRLDRTLRSVEDVEALGLTVLGILPTIREESERQRRQGYGYSKRRRRQDAIEPSKKDLIVHTHPMSAVAECCRTVRTNLMFAGAQGKLDSLVVTSANPREGKTTVAVSLATALAQSGKRVLIIDTDLRRPRLHRVFGLGPSAGTTSVLAGERHFEEAIQPTEVPGLSVLPCGPIPPNPSELLHTESFGQLVRDVTARFDRVIFDSPPLAAVTDAAIIAPQVGGVVVVLKAKQTTRDALRSSLRQLHDVSAHIAGGVVNDVDLHERKYGQSYTYYYYQHGYYSSEEDGEQSGDKGESRSRQGTAT